MFLKKTVEENFALIPKSVPELNYFAGFYKQIFL